MTPWTDREITRYQVREAMFVRRGMSLEVASPLADRLAARDQDHDDRRCCIECRHLQRDGGCFIARQGRLHGTSRRHEPVVDILQRCPGFEWQTT